MIDRPFLDIAARDIENLVLNSVAEGRTLDYKESLSIADNDQKKEFLRDVSAFANSIGGDLIYGVVEGRDASNKPTGLPSRICGIGTPNFDNLKLQLDQLIRSGIEPRIPSVQMREIVCTGGTVLVIRVGDSWARPHRVSLASKPQFHMRSNAGNVPFDYFELRDAFLRTADFGKRLKAFRDEQLAKIVSGDLLLPLARKHYICMHFLPAESFRQARVVDLSHFHEGRKRIPTMTRLDGYHRPNLDGLLQVQTGAEMDRTAYGYTQLFHNGSVELVDAFSIREANGEHAQTISLRDSESAIGKAMKETFSYLGEQGLESDVYLLISVLNVGGLKLYSNDRFGYSIPKRVDRNHLMFPEIRCELDKGYHCYFKMACDLFWQAFGAPASPSFDDNGVWLEPN